MKTIGEITDLLNAKKPELNQRYGISEIGIFGSYVLGKQNKRSDLDILIEFTRPVGLFEFIRLENYLSEITGLKVDLVMKNALKPRIGAYILREVQYV
ncbi:MAG: nucleotidyltransferase family protein [Chloroflexi bacterium]|nr:nucleotidyltransferase family protein [Chloroflexota bacterium]